MKDPILHAVTRANSIVTPLEVSANSAEPPIVEMDVVRENELPKIHFTDTEKLMDDLQLTKVLMETKFSTYSPDGYDSKEAERDVVYTQRNISNTH